MGGREEPGLRRAPDARENVSGGRGALLRDVTSAAGAAERRVERPSPTAPPYGGERRAAGWRTDPPSMHPSSVRLSRCGRGTAASRCTAVAAGATAPCLELPSKLRECVCVPLPLPRPTRELGKLPLCTCKEN